MKPTRLTWAEYAALDAFDHTILREFEYSPAHAYAVMTHPKEPTEAQGMGTAVHAAILEPETFASLYMPAPVIDRRTKEGKLRWAMLEDEAGSREILTAKDYEQCQKISSSVWRNAAVARLLKAEGHTEVSVSAPFDERINLKIRPDAIKRLDGFTFIPDIKTMSAHATPWSFGGIAAKYDYHSRAAMYLDVLQQAWPTDQDRRYVFIAIEKSEPWESAVFELDPNAIIAGRARYKKWAQQASFAVETKQWPGYPAEIQIVSLPPWAYKDAQLGGGWED